MTENERKERGRGGWHQGRRSGEKFVKGRERERDGASVIER